MATPKPPYKVKVKKDEQHAPPAENVSSGDQVEFDREQDRELLSIVVLRAVPPHGSTRSPKPSELFGQETLLFEDGIPTLTATVEPSLEVGTTFFMGHAHKRGPLGPIEKGSITVVAGTGPLEGSGHDKKDKDKEKSDPQTDPGSVSGSTGGTKPPPPEDESK